MGGVKRNTKKKYKPKSTTNNTRSMNIKTYTKSNTNEEKEVRDTKKTYNTTQEKTKPLQNKVNSTKSTNNKYQAPKPKPVDKNKAVQKAKPEVSSEVTTRKTTDVDVLSDLIKEIISTTVDEPYYEYSIIEAKNKRTYGIMTMNCIIHKKKDDNKKTLLFVINKDVKTGLINAAIIDGHTHRPSVLFVATDPLQEIKKKIEKYLPSIVISTQEMLK